MAQHHEDRERAASHPLLDYDGPERHHAEDTAERLEMDRNSPSGVAIPWSWSGLKEVGYVVGVVFMLSGGYYGLRSDNDKLAGVVEAVAVRVTVIERDRAVKVPEFDEMKRSNGLQDQRIQNTADANARTAVQVLDLGRIVAEQGRVLSDVRTAQAVMEERTGRGMPHDR